MRWLLCGAALLLGTLVALAQDAGTADTPVVDPENVTITIRTLPSGARIYYGKRMLGEAPIKITRKRDSGPMDLMVRRGGYFPVATRAYTFKDDIVIARLTHRDNASTLLGYKEPLPPDGGPDGGAGAPDGGVGSPEDAPLPPASQPIPPSPTP